MRGATEGGRIVRALALVVELAKVRITAAVTLTAAMGYFMFAERFTFDFVLPVFGVFLLACGSATLNHVQDARIDGLMERTRERPIPSGRIGRDWALFIAMVFLVAGFYALATVEVHVWVLLGLGALAVFWYNGVYTPLKRVTAFAIIPGSLIGALPPVMGWVSAGGIFWDPTILQVAFFLFLWQIPHFWCLLLMKARDYESAGLPSLSRILSEPQLVRVTSIWILTLAVAGVTLAAESQLLWPWKLAMLAASVWLAWKTVQVLRSAKDERVAFPSFMRINLYLLAVVACMTGNALA